MDYIIEDCGYIHSPQLLTSLLQLWLNHYSEINIDSHPEKTTLSHRELLHNLSIDESAVTALAVGYAYRELIKEYCLNYQRPTVLEYVTDTNQTFLRLEGYYYNAVVIHGTETVPNHDLEVCSFTELYHRHIHVDVVSTMYIKRFLQRLYLPSCQEIEHVLSIRTAPCPETRVWLNWLSDRMDTLQPFRNNPKQLKA